MTSAKSLVSVLSAPMLGMLTLATLTGCPNTPIANSPDAPAPQATATPTPEGSLGLALALMPANSWLVGSPMARERGGLSAGVLGNAIYAIGGDGEPTAELYDPQTNTWRVVTLPNTQRLDQVNNTALRARYFGASAALGGRIVYVGGTYDDIVGLIDVYDPYAPAWTDITTITDVSPRVSRMALASAIRDGVLYLLGGLTAGPDVTLIPTAAVETYDIARHETYAKTPLPTPRAGLGAGVIGQTLYVVGGFEEMPPKDEVGSPEALDSLLRYDEDAWSTQTPSGADLAPLNIARHSFGTAVLDGKLYVAGGMDSDGTVLDSVEEYDPVTNQWKLKASLPSPRVHLALVAFEGRLYALGGFDASGVAMRNVDIFRP